MATVTMHGNALQTSGEMPQVGTAAPDFSLIGNDMKPVTLADTQGKVRVLSVVPSVDTGVCSIQTKRFNQEFDSMPDSVVGYTVSNDTPFALKRFCGVEGVEKMTTLSDAREHKFSRDYGLYIENLGISARAVLIVDKTGHVAYTQLVPEIATEPNYDEVLQKARELV